MATLAQQMQELSNAMTQMMMMAMMGRAMAPAGMFAAAQAEPMMSINVKDFRPLHATITEQGKYTVDRVKNKGGAVELEGVTSEQFMILATAYEKGQINFTDMCAENGWDDIPMRMKQDLFALMGSRLLSVSWRSVK